MQVSSIELQRARIARELQASQNLNVTWKSTDPARRDTSVLVRGWKVRPFRGKSVAGLLLALLAGRDRTRDRDFRRGIGAGRSRIECRDRTGGRDRQQGAKRDGGDRNEHGISVGKTRLSAGRAFGRADRCASAVFCWTSVDVSAARIGHAHL